MNKLSTNARLRGTFAVVMAAALAVSCGSQISPVYPGAAYAKTSATLVSVAEGEGYADTLADAPRDPSGERYAAISENPFFRAADRPYSTFAIDVDTASWANTRSYLRSGSLPPPDAVRIEEFINYFPYEYEAPLDGSPFSVRVDRAECPWAEGHELLRVSIKGREMDPGQAPRSNLVFLVDTSGSMQSPDKLPLLKEAFKFLVTKLKPADRVSIVAYAGSAGLVLDATPGDRGDAINASLDRLTAGGSTAGGAGLSLAYAVALRNFIPGGNNRVIIATDGDFNVGPSSTAAIEELVAENAKKGVSVTVLGFGTGNYRDDMAEIIADRGDGNYAYIDGMPEARKVFGRDLLGTLFAIARDVKVQVLFDGERIEAWRLIGYENRVLSTEDFDDDAKDAGELGAGHSVTAFFEIVPRGGSVEIAQAAPEKLVDALPDGADCAVRLRWKPLDSDASMLVESAAAPAALPFARVDGEFRFAASVAAAGMLLRGSRWSGTASWDWVVSTAVGAAGPDPWGYRKEFVELARIAADLSRRK